MIDPITIGLIISGGVAVVTLVLQMLQSAKIHDIHISSCMKTTTTTNNIIKNTPDLINSVDDEES